MDLKSGSYLDEPARTAVPIAETLLQELVAEKGLFESRVTIILDRMKTSTKKSIATRVAEADVSGERLLVKAVVVLYWFLSLVNEQVVKILGGIL